MKAINHQLHSARIKNNCPECYSAEGLEFTFEQEEKENAFYSKATKAISEKLYCHNCEHIIYPVNWDEDIERVYDYHKKLAIPKNMGIKLKPLAYLVILADALLIGTLIYFLK